MQANPGAKLLAELSIGHAKDLNVDDLGMLVEEFLDLARIDVLPTANHHVLYAPDDVAITVLVQGCEIARMHPARGVDGLAAARLVGPVATHHGISPGQQLAGHARRHDAAFGIDDLDLEMGLDAPDGGDPPFDGIVGRALETDGARLCHAIRNCDFPHM